MKKKSEIDNNHLKKFMENDRKVLRFFEKFERLK